MDINVGATDSKIRLGAAAVLGVLALVAGLNRKRGKVLAGAAALVGVTGATHRCPAYCALDVDTLGK